MANINNSSLITQLQTVINGLTLATETKERLISLVKSAQFASANASTIITQLESRIETVTTSEELKEYALLSVAAALSSGDREHSVATIGDLPATATAGSIYYVTSEGLAYIRRLNGTWILIETNSQLAPKQPNAWSWGNAADGRLGDNTVVNKSSPVSVVGGFADWVQVSVSYQHTVGVRANGTAWAWGNNSGYGAGRLGDNTTVTKSSPVSVVGGFTDWIQVSAGSSHSVGLRANGSIWAWGYNLSGQIGDNTTVSKLSPVSVVGGFTDWIQVSAGGGRTVGLRTNGTAWSWGSNIGGRLGDNTTVTKSSPVSVVGGFTDWIQVSAGDSHTVGVRANGTAWSWGNNTGSGALGDNTTVNRSSPVAVVGGFTDWVQVDAGESFTVGLRANGTAWAWGAGGYGRLGDNTVNIPKSSPVSVLGGFTDWVQVSAGNANAIGLRANGTAWGWGYNSAGQLGTGSITNRSSPVAVVGGFTDWVQVAAGQNHTVAIRA